MELRHSRPATVLSQAATWFESFNDACCPCKALNRSGFQAFDKCYDILINGLIGFVDYDNG